MKLLKQLTTVTPFSKKLALLLFFLLPIIGFKLGMYYQESIDNTKQRVSNDSSISPQTNTLSQQTITPSPVVPLEKFSARPTDDWKTYTNTHYNFSFKYPPTWDMMGSTNQPENSPTARYIRVAGKEGEVFYAIGDGFGGGCDMPQHKKMYIFGSIHEFCSGVYTDKGVLLENYGQIYEKLGNYTLSLTGKANNPISENRQIILTVIASFHYIDF